MSLRQSHVPLTIKCTLFLSLILVIEEVIFIIIVEIVFKILQIIRGKETIYGICDTRYCCYCTDDCQYPQHLGLLFYLLLLV